MDEPPDPDDAHADENGSSSPEGEVVRAVRPMYRTRPREFYLLWFVALLTYGIGDTATTIVAVFTVPTLTESNLVLAGVLAHGGLAGFLLVKFLVLLAMLAISVRGTRRDDRFAYYWPPVATALLGVLLTGWNLRLLATAG
jgi:hypothetical protein